VQRFGLYVNNTAESGSNAGSDFAFRAYSDAGTLLSTPLFIKRSLGSVIINGTTSDLLATGYKFISIGNSGFQYAPSGGTYLTIEPGGPNEEIAIKADARSGSYPPIAFYTSTIKRLTIADNGPATFSNGVGISGATAETSGIQFPATQVASASANNLDDYEEGTWTMGLAFGGASVGVTYGGNTGTYTKIGRKVTITGYMNLTSKGTSTGNARITGLPFTSGSNASFFGVPSLFLTLTTFTGQFTGLLLNSSNTININQITNLGVESALTDVNFSNSSEIIVTLTYFV
jgi:hypothetical protein